MKIRNLTKKKKKDEKKKPTGGGIVLADGTRHTKAFEKLGYWVGMWNGEKCHCRMMEVTVLDKDDSIHRLPWWKPYIGQTFQAVEISYYGETFYISNADGSGLSKVTVGRGLPTAGHAQFESVEPGKILIGQKEWVIGFDIEKSNAIAEAGENYWRVRDPDHWTQIRELRLNILKTERLKKEAYEKTKKRSKANKAWLDKKSTNFLRRQK